MAEPSCKALGLHGDTSVRIHFVSLSGRGVSVYCSFFAWRARGVTRPPLDCMRFPVVWVPCLDRALRASGRGEANPSIGVETFGKCGLCNGVWWFGVRWWAVLGGPPVGAHVCKAHVGEEEC